MAIEIRRATPTDSERATELARRAKAHWGYPAEWLEAWNDDLIVTAEDAAAAFIVIGLRRRSPVGKLLLGSNAQRVLLDASCPVLAVKA